MLERFFFIYIYLYFLLRTAFLLKKKICCHCLLSACLLALIFNLGKHEFFKIHSE